MAVALTKSAIDLGIVTTNGPAMLQFYRDTLGLKFVREMKISGGATMHQLACGDSVVKVVVAKNDPVAAAPGGIPGGAGFRYFTISVSNLTEMMQTCVDAGCKVAVKETELRPGVRIGIVEDPDGNWVEFLSV